MIKRVETGDWELLRAVRLRALHEDPAAFLATHAQESLLTSEEWQTRAGGSQSASFVFVADRDAEGLATGLLTEDPGTVILVGMWVAPAERGSGAAPELVAHVLDWARTQGAKRVYLSVEGGNERAARLYLRCGFAELDEPPKLPYEPNPGNRFFAYAL